MIGNKEIRELNPAYQEGMGVCATNAECQVVPEMDKISLSIAPADTTNMLNQNQSQLRYRESARDSFSSDLEVEDNKSIKQGI